MDAMEFCYRVREHPDGTWKVHVMFPPPHVGTIGWAKEYPDFDALPYDLRERIAVIQLAGGDVNGVGRRHDSVPPTYWIYVDHDVMI